MPWALSACSMWWALVSSRVGQVLIEPGCSAFLRPRSVSGDGVLGLFVHDVVARGFLVLGGGKHVVRHVLAALGHDGTRGLVQAGGLLAACRR